MTSPYRPLPSNQLGVLARHRLYDGGDHVLMVSTTGYHEDYRRFFYSDIQALVWRKTHGGTLASFLTAVPLIASFALLTQPDSVVPFALIATPFAIALVLQWIAGPTCAFEIITALQAHRLPAVRRLKTARKLMARITPKIMEVQAIQTPESPASATSGNPPVAPEAGTEAMPPTP